MATQKDPLLALISIYEEAEQHILASLDSLAGTYDLARKAVLYQQLIRFLAKLQKQTDQWAATKIEYYLERAAKKAGKEISLVGVSPLGSVVNQEAIRTLSTALSTPLANISDAATREALKLYRATALAVEFPDLDLAARREVAVGLAQGNSVPQIGKRIQELLKARYANGLVEIIGKNGRTYRFSVSRYAAMVAGGVTRQAMTVGTINRATEQGYDLVKLSEQPSTTGDYCNLYAGKIFSISGNDSRFPALSEMPGGGAPLHSHCRHSISIFIPDFYTEAQMDKMTTPDKWLLSNFDGSTNKLIKAYWKSRK